MPLNGLQKTFLCGEVLASEDLNSIILVINNTVTTVNTIEGNLEGHQYDVSVPITSIYCRTKKNINASGFFPQSDALKEALFLEVLNCQLTQGIKYNVNFLTVTLDNVADNMNGVWTAYPQGISEELPHEWVTSFKKLEDSNEIIFMFGPVLVSNYGFSGTDGDGVQYVYKLFDHELTELERTTNTPIKPVSPNLNGEYIPSGWSDDPLGATSEYPYEYVATLKRINGNWGDFEKIALWGTYSEDGINGDFQTRVFCRFNPTVLKPSPNKPLGGTYDSPQPGSNDGIAWSMTVPSGDGLVWTSTRTFKGNGTETDWSIPVIESDSNELDIEYSSSITRPSIDTLRGTPGVPHPSNNVWHDPSESGIDLSSMIWRAERKIKNRVYEGNWVITRLAGVKGSFKSMVFKRFTPTILLSSPATPSGGTYNSPIPSGWSDGIPNGDGPVWSSVCTFTEEDTEPVSALRWSLPQLQLDSEALDIEFSPGIGEGHAQPSNPNGEPFSNKQSQGWYDPSASNFNSVGPMIWRAECKVINGQYEGSWVVSRIKGEQGEEGKRGEFKSFVFKRSNDVISSIAAADDNATYDNPKPNNTWSDSVPEGTATLWMAVSKFTGIGDNHTSWTVSQLSDNIDLDIEFSKSTTEPLPPTGNPFSNRSSQGWYNSNTIPPKNDANNPGPIVWRAERKVYEGKFKENDPWVVTRILGEKGDNVALTSEQTLILEKAGLEIIINPQNIILDLSGILTSANDDKIDNDFTVNISVYKNGTILNTNDYLINSNSVLMYGNGSLLAFSNTNNNTFFEVQSKAIIIKNLPITTSNNQYTYTYNKGYIKGTIAVTLEGTTYNVPFNIPWYLNKLGERESKILGDVETTYMSRDSFTNPENPLYSSYSGRIESGANGLLLSYQLIKRNAGDTGYESNVLSADYVLTAELNLANLKKTITGTNLLPQNNWTNVGGTILDINSNLINYSPFIYLNPGTYIFSCYSQSDYNVQNISYTNLTLQYRSSATKPNKPSDAGNNNSTTGVTHKGILVADLNSGYEGDYYTINSVAYPRWYIKLVITEAKYYTLCITSGLLGRKYYRPQLELCITSDETPTPWVPGPLEFSSEIKQTADEITTSLTGPNSAISLVQQTLTGITSTVKASGSNKNLFNFTTCSFGLASSDCGHPVVQSYGMLLKFAGNSDVNGRLARVTIPGLETGKNYTFSCQAKMTNASAGIEFDLGDSLGGLQTVQIGTTWLDIEVTMPFNRTGQKWLDMGIVSDNYTSGNYALLRHIKIEEGTMATAFSIAEEDINNVTNVRPVDEWNMNSIIEDTTITGPTGKKVYKTSSLPDQPVSDTLTYIDYISKNNLSTIQIGKVYTISYWVKASVSDVFWVETYLYPDISTEAQDFMSASETGGLTESIRTDGATYGGVPTLWTKRYVHFYVETKPSNGLIHCLPIRLARSLNSNLNSSGVLYISDVLFCEGYVTDKNNNINESYSEIKQTANSISLLAGVSESTLNTAGLYLRAELNEEPSMVKVIAGQFKVVLPPEEEGDLEEIVFGNDPNTNTMVFSGDLKTGEEDYDYYNSDNHYLNIFPNFSTGEYYKKGKCVRYNNKVYRFNEVHPSGAWKTGEQIDYEEIDSEYLDDLIVNTNSIYTDGSGRLGGGHIYWNSSGSIYLGTGSVTPKGNNYKSEDFERNWYVEHGEPTWDPVKDTVFDKLYGGRYASDGLRIINNFTDSEGNINTTISLQADNTLDLSLGRIGLTNNSISGGEVSVSPYTNDLYETSVSISTQTGFVISRKNYNDSNDSHDDQWREHYGSSGALTISYNTTPKGAASTIVNTLDEEYQNGKDLGLKIKIKALDGNAYKGFTGECGSMYFINGICVGPTTGFSNNVAPFTTPNS